MRYSRANSDLLIAQIADKRHGVVRTDHLRSVGLDKFAVRRRVVAGRLHRKFPGVYAVGHEALSLKGRWMAAVDACGPGAVLSHLAAACLWRFLEWRDYWPIDVTVPGDSGKRPRPGIRIHRSKTLSLTDAVERDSIPVTNPPRLFRDLPRVAEPELVREATRQAEIKGWKHALPAWHIPNRSELEWMFLELCRRHRLPTPQTRVKIGPYEADFLFAEHNLIVETDGGGTHRSAHSFEDDHERDLFYKLAGYEVLRFTYRQISERPGEVAKAVRTLLARRARAA